jgi:raffinose/stachyose/melibiose transport system permease protein
MLSEPAAAASRRRHSRSRRRSRHPLGLALPALAVFVPFFLVAAVGSLYLSFTDWNASTHQIRFNGFENFRDLWGQAQFRQTITNGLELALLTTAAKVILGTGLALLLNRRFPGRNIFRALFFLPYLLSAFAVGYIFTFVFNPTHGLLNEVLRAVGLGSLRRDWLGDIHLALFTVAGVDIWMGVGFAALIVLAGLQTVPRELVEAANLDGAGTVMIFRHITLPFLRPALTVVTVISIVAGFRMFDLVQALTNGGPGYRTEVVSTLQYKSLGLGSLGYASAIGLVQFAVITVIAIPIMWRMQKRQIVQ